MYAVDDCKREYLKWSSNQSHILTGNGSLNSIILPGRDFRDVDLPHFLLLSGQSWEIFSKWKASNRQSTLITGAWARTIFTGGWSESSLRDTEAFNLQTPTIFIDLRFPISRPKFLSAYSKLSDLSLDDLQLLSRQHCFGGYTFPSKGDDDIPIFTRHHIIDWNYHPAYPRPRPNRWWVDISDDRSSFKEYSVARDKFGVPLYFERWVRYSRDSIGTKYLAFRRRSGCEDTRDALLVVVGDHFAMAYDRATPFPDFPGSSGPGGPALVDYAIEKIEQGDSWAVSQGREAVERYLDLEGSYGRLTETPDGVTWNITRSTHPWREGQSLWSRSEGGTYFEPKLEFSTTGELKGLLWTGWWEVLECSFGQAALTRLFRPQKPATVHRSFL